jgi:NAD+ synthase
LPRRTLGVVDEDRFEPLAIDAPAVAARIEEFLRAQVEAFARDGAALGVSGGIDSAVVAALAARALGPERVLALVLPERDSSARSRTDALRLIAALGLPYRELDLTPALRALGVYDLLHLEVLGLRGVKEAVVRWQHRTRTDADGETPFRRGILGTRGLGKDQRLVDRGLAYGRVKPRLRMVAVYLAAEQENRLVLGTTNRSEVLTGFVAKWGDAAADVEPLLPLYKTQVRQLARYLGVPDEIVDKAPSPDVLPGLGDEDALGIGFATLDRVLDGLERGLDPAHVAATACATDAQVRAVREMVRRSQHLRELPPQPGLPPGGLA